MKATPETNQVKDTPETTQVKDTPETNQPPEVETQLETPLEETPETQQEGNGKGGNPCDSQEVSDLSASVSTAHASLLLDHREQRQL